MSIKNRGREIVARFKNLASWEDRYRKIIEIGRGLQGLDESLKTEDLKVRGCQSQVWIKADLTEDHKVIFQADSDALIVRGLVALLVEYYSGSSPEEILSNPPDFIEELGFSSHLSPSRAGGLMAMIRQIKYYATAYQALLNMNKGSSYG